ncbi:protein phosphatase 1 regulatory subunit 3A [Heterodontus francisci]|uniref:protein phosphatase 1 regulatory subunit 3A n=1 Tax=Heterodontus francisci TaxID=7792 RepID=UPI00355C215B
MESAEKVQNQHFAASLLGLPAEDDVFAEDEDTNEIWIKPKLSPLPRRRSNSSDEGSEPPLTLNRKVSFADAFGLELVSVREYDKWDLPTGTLGGEPQGERPPLEECLLLPLFELPSSPEDLMRKLYAQKVELESAEFPPGITCMKGVIRVLNISYEKLVYIRMTLNHWDSYYDILADYVADSCDGATDQFTFKILLVPPYLKDGTKVEFAIRYETRDAIYWANNDHKNYVMLCHKKDDPNANEKFQEELDDRNLKSCLKTSYSKEILETSYDDGCTILPSSKAQQENRETILETNTITQCNTESLFDENAEQKEEKSKQQPDTQIHPPLHISLTTPRGQETNLTVMDGSHSQVTEENEKAATAVSESPTNQQNDLEVEHNEFTSVNNGTENKVKQEKEYEWVGILFDSNRSTSNLSTQSHEGSINTTVQTDNANVVTSNDNIMTQFSNLFCDEAHLLHEGSLLSQGGEEAVTSHVIDTSTKPELEMNSFSGSNTDSVFANNVQDNLVIIHGVIDESDKHCNNTPNPTEFLQENTDAENLSGEYIYLTDDTLTINESESIPISAVCTNTDLEFEPDRNNSSVHGSISLKEEKVFRTKISETQEPPLFYSKAENLEDVKQENYFSEKPYLTNKGAESMQEQSSIKQAPKVTAKERFTDRLEVTNHSVIGKEMAIAFQVAAKEENSCDMYSNDRRIETDTADVTEFLQYTNKHSASDSGKHQNTGNEFGTCLQTTSSKQPEVTNAPNIETTAMVTEIPALQGSLEEKYQHPCEMNKILTQIPEIDSPNKDTANEQKENKVEATRIAKQCISAPSCILADTVVKEAIEAALFEITGDEGRTTTAVSLKRKAMQHLPSEEKFSKSIPEVTTAFHLTTKHEQPSKIHITYEQIAKSVSNFDEHLTETSIACPQMEEDLSNASQKNTEEEATPTISLHTKTFVPISDNIKYPDAPCSYGQPSEVAQNFIADFQKAVEKQSEVIIITEVEKGVADSMKMLPDLQEEAEETVSCETTNTNERIPENIFESVELKITDNCEVKQAHTEVAKKLAINLMELPEEKVHYNENEKDIDITQNCNVSDMNFKHNYSVPDVKESIEVGKAGLKGEEALSIKSILQYNGGTDESRSMGFTQLHNVTGISQTIKEIMSAPEQIAEEEADQETSKEYEVVNKQKCGTDNEAIMDSDRERVDIFSESIGAHSFEKVEIFHDTQQVQINENSNQNAVRPKNITKIGSTPNTSSDTWEKKNRITTPPHNSELHGHHKHLDPVILISTPAEEDEEKETNSDVSGNIHPYSEGLDSEECNEKTLENEQADEACDGNVKSEESRSQRETFADEITLKNTVWKVCYFVLFFVFLVTIYHYDFIGCFALYLFSLYWLFCEGETSSDSVRKE